MDLFSYTIIIGVKWDHSRVADDVTRADTDKPNLTHICQHGSRPRADNRGSYLRVQSRLSNYNLIVITSQGRVIRFKLSALCW